MIHRSPFPDVALPETSLPAFVLEAAARHGDRPALTDAATGRALTFRDVVTLSWRVADGLGRRGFGKGQVLSIVAPNLPEYPAVYLGAALGGGAVNTLNPLLTERELGTLLAYARARFVVTVGALLDKVLPAAAQAGVEDVFVIGAGPGATPFAALLGDAVAPGVPLDPAADLASLPCSSGTSGSPKSVMLTHRNLIAQLIGFDAAVGIGGEQTVLAVLPYFHIYGLSLIMLLNLWRGRHQVVMSRFELEPFLDALARYRVTWAPVVPPILIALAKHPVVDAYDLSALRFVTSGAAPLGADVERAAADRLGCVVFQGYGMTEVAGASHVQRPETDRLRTGSVGQTIPNHEVRIVDPVGGADRGPNERGELWIRGPCVMRGYLDRPEATAEVLVEDGWLRTGDVAYVDDDGYFYVVDRIKELIKYKGWQVAPADLEALLLTHPAIADAAVIPSPDPEAGEVPKAFVVAREPLTAEAVMDYVAERVAPYERVRRVEFLPAIPKSPSGKILRRVLVERERDARKDAASTV